jgi:hypothetical protein
VVVDHVPRSIASFGPVDQYLNRPHRTSFGVFVPLAMMDAFCVEAWRSAVSTGTRVAMTAPGVALWLVVPLVAGAPPKRLAFFVAGALEAVALLLLGRRRRWTAAALAPVLVLELVGSTFFVRQTMTFGKVSPLILPLIQPHARVSSRLEPTPIASALQAHVGEGRYLTLGRSKLQGALQTNESIVYGIESTGGYLSVQLTRYWLFVRALTDLPQARQYAFFQRPPPQVLDLLQVNWIVASDEDRADVEAGATQVASDGRWVLFRRPVTVPRASALFDWTVVGSASKALETVATPGFDTASTAVLEEDPGIQPSPGGGATPAAGSVTYTALGPQAARVEVDLPASAIILVRNVYDPTWRATVDGHGAKVLAVDSVVQGIAVTAGHHVIALGYDDPTIGWGMLASGLALAALAGAFWRSRRVSRGTPRSPRPEPAARCS